MTLLQQQSNRLSQHQDVRHHCLLVLAFILMKKITATLFAFCVLALMGRAQTDSATVWTLEDCLNYARQHNIQIRSLRLSGKSAYEDLQQAKASRLPSVNATLTQNLVNSNNTNPVVGGFQTQASFSGNYGLSSSMALYSGGYIKNDIKSKELAQQSAALNIAEAANDITLQITEAYLNVLLAKENIVYLREMVTSSALQLKQGNERLSAGSIAKKELLQLQAQAAADDYNLTDADNTLRTNLLSLRSALQLPAGYQLAVYTPDTLKVFESAPALEKAIDMAERSRPEIANGNIAIERSQVEITKLRSYTLPSLSLGAGIASGYSNNQQYKYFNQLGNNFYQSLGLTLSVPIYNRRVNKTNINKQKIETERSILELDNTRLALNQQIEQAYINMQNAQARYTSATKQFRANEQSVAITNRQFELGSVNTVELQQQKNLYVQALQNYTQAKYSAVLYNKIYAFYTGAPVDLK
jgi:outer membrane protein